MGSINIKYEGKTESHEMEALSEKQGGECGGAEVIEVTKEEYDSLPDSKYTDGKLYKIKDININGDATTVTYVDPDGNKTNVAAELDKVGNVYSLEEKVIGIDYDGSPIYQRTFTGSLTNFTEHSTEMRSNAMTILLTNIKRLVNAKGFVRYGASETNYSDLQIGSTTMDMSGALQRSCFCYVRRDSNLVIMVHGMTKYQYCPLYVVTVEYTKL